MKFAATNLNVATLAAGAGIALLSPVVFPLVAGILKPVTKNAIKGSLLVYGKAKQSVAAARVSIEPVTAEARQEIAESKPAKKKTAPAKA